MTITYKKKLIEVALPLEEINAASAKEKSIRHGHPSTLHLWWARRPLASSRAVLLALLLPDPSDPACPPEFRLEARTLLARVPGAILQPRKARWERSAKVEPPVPQDSMPERLAAPLRPRGRVRYP